MKIHKVEAKRIVYSCNTKEDHYETFTQVFPADPSPAP